MTTSTVLICPAATQDAGNRFFCAIGQDELPGYTFGRELTTDQAGAAPATHYASHTMSTADLLETLTDLKNGILTGPLVPADVDWTEWGTTEADVLAFGAAFAMAIQGNDELGRPLIKPHIFFANSAALLGLVDVVIEE